MKKLLAMLLAAAMTIGTASVALADDTGLFELNGTRYDTLQDAVNAAGEGDTITLLGSTVGSGVKVASEKNFTIDFGGFTYTVNDETVGSTGTKTNGFQILKDSNITMQNGTILAGEYAKILIQNYSDLKLNNMVLDARDNSSVSYVMSNNCGNVQIIGNTSIYARPGQKAFDVYYWPDNGYADGVTVTIDTTGEIVGDVEYGSDGTAAGKADIAEKAALNVVNGKIDGEISTHDLGDNGETKVDVTGGIFTSDTWIANAFTEKADVIAKLMDGDDVGAYHIGPASKTIDASDYDGVVVTKAVGGAVKVAGDNVQVRNGMETPLSVNGNTVPADGTVVVTREPAERDTTGGDYFGNAKWDEVKREIAAAEEGDTIEMSATGLPWFPSSVARALKGKDVTLEVRKNGVTYSINGLEIGAIEKIWYEFDQIDTELLTVEAE